MGMHGIHGCAGSYVPIGDGSGGDPGGGGTGVPILARRADEVAAIIGISCKGENADEDFTARAFAETGIRNYRTSNVAIGPGVQRRRVQALQFANLGIIACINISDENLGAGTDGGNNYTPADRIAEATSANWAGMTIGWMEMGNEVQSQVVPNSSAWIAGPNLTASAPYGAEPNISVTRLAAPATLGNYNGTQGNFSKNETLRQLWMGARAWAARSLSGTAANAKFVAHSYSFGHGQDWPTILGDLTAIEPTIVGNVHQYVFGMPFSRIHPDRPGVPPMRTICAKFDATNGTSGDRIVTEWGRHFCQTQRTKTPFTPERVSAIYHTWDNFLALDTPNVSTAFYFTMADGATGAPGEDELYRGLYKIEPGHENDTPPRPMVPRAPAIVIGCLNRLYDDRDASMVPRVFTPGSITLDIPTTVANLEYRVHQKASGAFLIAVRRNEKIYQLPDPSATVSIQDLNAAGTALSNPPTYSTWPASLGTEILVPDVNVDIGVPAGLTYRVHRFISSTNTLTPTYGEVITTLTRNSGTGTITVPVGADASFIEAF